MVDVDGKNVVAGTTLGNDKMRIVCVKVVSKIGTFRHEIKDFPDDGEFYLTEHALHQTTWRVRLGEAAKGQ